jgi:hypothetical protein
MPAEKDAYKEYLAMKDKFRIVLGGDGPGKEVLEEIRKYVSYGPEELANLSSDHGKIAFYAGQQALIGWIELMIEPIPQEVAEEEAERESEPERPDTFEENMELEE